MNWTPWHIFNVEIRLSIICTQFWWFQRIKRWIIALSKWMKSSLLFWHLTNWIIIVRVVFCLWAVKMTRVMRKVPHFGVGIVWGAIPSGLPVFWITVPGNSRNSYGTSPNLWVQKKPVKLRQGSQDTWLCFANSLESFLVTLPSISSETWEM